MARLTRRNFIHAVGGLGGSAAAYATASAMGLIATPVAYARAPTLAAGVGQGQSVAILGAGMAGLTAAYELAKGGFECTVLEASEKAGGRNRTYRGGDVIVETDGTQLVDFDSDPGLYFNAGPARLPYHHQGVLSYCHEFGVPLEPIVNDNRAAFFHDPAAFDGAVVRNRQLVNDTRGFVSELLAKAIDKGALDDELSALDRDTFLDFLSRFGDLDAAAYGGSSRSGYREPPASGLSAPGDPLPPIDMVQLLQSDFWGYKLYFGEGFTQAATMMQPVGGMDKIVDAFVERVGALISYGSTVTKIAREGEGARITYTDADGNEQTLTADHVIVTIPFSVLSAIETDFSEPVNAAIDTCAYVKAAKAAFQAERRFWERDANIYGGISWSNADITQIWYPTSGFGREKGIIVGAYIWSDSIGETFGDLSYADRLEMCLTQGEKLHPTYREDVSSGCSIAWAKTPFEQGGWASWSDEARADAYAAVTEPDGPYHFAGEHISYLTGWQEGSVLSAHDCVRTISERVAAATP